MTTATSLELASKALALDFKHSKAPTEQLIHFYDHVIMVFGDDTTRAKNWLHASSAQFNQSSAASLIMTEEGLVSVIAVLRKILEQDSRIG